MKGARRLPIVGAAFQFEIPVTNLRVTVQEPSIGRINRSDRYRSRKPGSSRLFVALPQSQNARPCLASVGRLGTLARWRDVFVLYGSGHIGR
jgi:hypothetical protein